MGDRRYRKTLLLSVAGIGDIFVEHGPSANVAELLGHLDQPPSPNVRSLRVERTGKTLAPPMPLMGADLRSGDLVSLVDVDPVIGVDDHSIKSVSATLEMTSGPASGSRFELVAGTSTIGRVAANDIVIVDPGISRHHASVTVDNKSVTIVDNRSTNGIMVEGELITGPTPLRSGQRVLLGQSWVKITHRAVVDVDPPAAELRPSTEQRSTDRYPEQNLVLPAPPDVAGKGRRLELLSPRKSQYKMAVEQFQTAIGAVVGRLEEGRQLETAARLSEAPSLNELIHALGSESRLWDRRVAHPDGLVVRLGLGRLPSRTRLQPPGGGEPSLRAQLAEIGERFAFIDGVPALIDFRLVGSLGIHGHPDHMRQLAYALVSQLVLGLGPDQLAIAFRPGDRSPQWEWLKWLPHVDLGASTVGVAASEFVAWVSTLLDQSSDSDHDEEDARRPATLVIIDDDRPLPAALLARLVEDGPAVGVYSLLLAGDSAGFDVPVGATVGVGPGTAVVEWPGHGHLTGVAAESCDRATASTVAQTLTPVLGQSVAPNVPEPPALPIAPALSRQAPGGDSADSSRDEPEDPMVVGEFVLGGPRPPHWTVLPAPPPERTSGEHQDQSGPAEEGPLVDTLTTLDAADGPVLPVGDAAGYETANEVDDEVDGVDGPDQAEAPQPTEAVASPAPSEFGRGAWEDVGYVAEDADRAAPSTPPTAPTVDDSDSEADPEADVAADIADSADAGPEDGEDPGPSDDDRSEPSAEGSTPAEAETVGERQLDLATLPAADVDSRLVLGTVQVDDNQSHALFAFNLPRDGSLALAGRPGSGKTSALLAVAASVGMLKVEPGEVPVVYYLDVVGGLADLAALPYTTGALRTDIDGFRSVVTDIDRLLTDRVAAFDQANVATLDQFRERVPLSFLRRVIIVIDEIDQFIEMYDSLQPGRCHELLTQVLVQGQELGVHLVFSVGDRALVDRELADKVGRWLELGGGGCEDGSPSRPGRATVAQGEVRFATLGADRSVQEAIGDLARQLADRGVNHAATDHQAPPQP